MTRWNDKNYLVTLNWFIGLLVLLLHHKLHIRHSKRVWLSGIAKTTTEREREKERERKRNYKTLGGKNEINMTSFSPLPTCRISSIQSISRVTSLLGWCQGSEIAPVRQELPPWSTSGRANGGSGWSGWQRANLLEGAKCAVDYHKPRY